MSSKVNTDDKVNITQQSFDGNVRNRQNNVTFEAKTLNTEHTNNEMLMLDDSLYAGDSKDFASNKNDATLHG